MHEMTFNFVFRERLALWYHMAIVGIQLSCGRHTIVSLQLPAIPLVRTLVPQIECKCNVCYVYTLSPHETVPFSGTMKMKLSFFNNK